MRRSIAWTLGGLAIVSAALAGVALVGLARLPPHSSSPGSTA